MKKIAWCLWLVLAMPSMALSAEKRDGTYYCTVKFVGGVAYNNVRRQWEGASFEPTGNFVMKLSFRETRKIAIRNLPQDRDEYDVTITDEGMPLAKTCSETDGKPSYLVDPPRFLDEETGLLKCDDGLTFYRFNLDNKRFIKIYKPGYVDGKDGGDTPAISGGLCTKIQ